MKQFTSTNVDRLSRRDFLKVAGGLGLSAVGMTLLEACGVTPGDTLETTMIRLGKGASVCYAPQYLAEDLLKQEGFTDVQYKDIEHTSIGGSIASGDTDFGMLISAPNVIHIDAGDPLVILSGVHVGCFELFVGDQVTKFGDLKGKTIPVGELDGLIYDILATILVWVNIDPATEVNWLVGQDVTDMPSLLADGKVDAVLAFPPTAQEMHAKKIGHVLLNSMMDKPWSQYYCCMAIANQDFVQKNPVASKRALRAILKATDLCASEPERAAKYMVDKGFTENYDYALQAMQQIPYNVWRNYDPEDTVIFYANRLRDAGLIKSNANDIVAKGTNWRFLNELKQELKE